MCSALTSLLEGRKTNKNKEEEKEEGEGGRSGAFSAEPPLACGPSPPLTLAGFAPEHGFCRLDPEAPPGALMDVTYCSLDPTPVFPVNSH